jgi:hypothetical protein
MKGRKWTMGHQRHPFDLISNASCVGRGSSPKSSWRNNDWLCDVLSTYASHGKYTNDSECQWHTVRSLKPFVFLAALAILKGGDLDTGSYRSH